ncbi:MAG: DUF370 domain-containing protein [Oscillospiraceae bacterium]|nr:DUF370 domain-containing protein [Oscillospiraceae bacterium]
MYIHLGSDTVVRDEDVIGIFDIENTSTEKFTREYLLAAQKRKSVINVNLDMPRAFIVVQKDLRERVYITPVSSSTLMKRANRNR